MYLKIWVAVLALAFADAQLECTWDKYEGKCLMQQSNSDQLDWSKKEGPSNINMFIPDAPPYDHSNGTQWGSYLYISPSTVPVIDNIIDINSVSPAASMSMAEIKSDMVYTSGLACVEMWYWNDASPADYLELTVDDGNGKRLATRTIRGTNGEPWKAWTRESVTVDRTQIKVNVAAYLSSDYRNRLDGILAIDSLSVTNGACNGQEMLEHLEYRLAGGQNAMEGRVEVQYRGAWGAVCRDGFGWKEAVTVCASMGLSGGRTRNLPDFGVNNLPFVLDDLNCPNWGTNSLSKCSHAGYWVTDCLPEQVARVRCGESEVPFPWDRVRLANANMGSDYYEGRVEVKVGNEWGTVCDRNWGQDDANAVCRMLGFNNPSEAKRGATYGQGTGRIQWTDVNCPRDEVDFTRCRRSTDTRSCSHYNDAGVKCYFRPSKVPFSCSFGDMCGFIPSQSARYEWNSGYDYTIRENALALKTYQQTPGVATTVSPVFSAMPKDTVSLCIKFKYYAEGQRTGPLEVFAKQGSGLKSLLKLSNHAATGNWQDQTLLLQESSVQLVFTALLGPDFSGTLGVSGLTVNDGSCAGGQTIPDSNRPGPNDGDGGVNAGSSTVFTCDFDNNKICPELENTQVTSQTYEWTKQKGPTSTDDSGPETDASGSGYYIYTETSDPRRMGDLFHIFTKDAYGDRDMCLKFKRYMYGVGIGTLNIKMCQQNNCQTLFNTSYDQGQVWTDTSVEIPSGQPRHILFEGVKGIDWRGDISIDDIRLYEGTCSGGVQPSTDGAGHDRDGDNTVEGTDQDGGTDLECDFDTDCTALLRNSTAGDFQWLRWTGPTGSQGTGPDSAYNGGYYAYIETSDPRSRGDQAIMETERQRFGQNYQNMCLKFARHLFGQHMGSLTIHQCNTTCHKLYTTKEETNGQWELTEVSIRGSQNGGSVKFTGVKGNGYQGDIAVDDIRIVRGNCPNPTTMDSRYDGDSRGDGRDHRT